MYALKVYDFLSFLKGLLSYELYVTRTHILMMKLYFVRVLIKMYTSDLLLKVNPLSIYNKYYFIPHRLQHSIYPVCIYIIELEMDTHPLV